VIRITALLASIFIIGTAQADEPFITLGSATSAQDSGLLDYFLPIFRSASGINIHVMAVGTGKALAIGERGDADALLVHDRIGEDKFVAEGFGIDRRGGMYDDYIIVGPDADPADIRGLTDASKTFARIASARVLYVSSGDDTGTHRMELRLWKLAGIEPGPRDTWYRELGEGMRVTLNTAAAMNGTL